MRNAEPKTNCNLMQPVQFHLIYWWNSRTAKSALSLSEDRVIGEKCWNWKGTGLGNRAYDIEYLHCLAYF